jgi:HD-GYP domain-containing protein (c-di-GMP phosphodiesterase class II)
MLRDFAKTISKLIDFRSRFTATHSSGVAAVAKELSILSGLSEKECYMMEVAGYLHDLGKLSVPNTILEKRGALSDAEYNIIRKHSYYTFIILRRLRGLEHIAAWAAYHHERPDGNGYPFHVKYGDFSTHSRIVSVADIITALTEDRPYRRGMNREKVEGILYSMSKRGGVDEAIAELTTKNFSHINDIREASQHDAKTEYNTFRDICRLTPVNFSEAMVLELPKVGA